MADAEAADATADARAPATRERPTSLAETLSDGERRKLAACMAQTWCGTLGYFGTFTTHVGIDDSGRDRRVAYYGTGESGCYRAPTIGTPCLRAVADELVAEREWLAGSTFGLVVTGPYAQWRFRDERDLAWLDKARTR